MDTKALIDQVTENNEGQENYMFFGNLQQIQRQCEILLSMDPDELDSIIKNGHDWAADHVSEAKNNIDQVFDFLMNEIPGNDGLTEGDGQPGFDLPYGDESPMPYTLTFNWRGKTRTLNAEGSRHPNKNAMVNANLAKFLKSYAEGIQNEEDRAEFLSDLGLHISNIKKGPLKIRPGVS